MNLLHFHQKQRMLSAGRYLTILLTLCSFSAAFAQYPNMLHKAYADRILEINNLYSSLVSLNDSAAILKKTEEIKEYARVNNDKEMEMEMDAFCTYYYTAFQKHKEPLGTTLLRIKNMISAADKAGIKHIKVRAMRQLADLYWHYIKNYELAFEQYLLMDKELSGMSETDYPDMAKELLIIGNAYYFFHEMNMAKAYLQKVVKLKETAFNTQFINSAKNTLGLCYQQEGNLVESDYYFNSILRTRFPCSKTDWEGIAKGNLGENCYLRGDYKKAIPLLEYNYRASEKENDFGNAAGALITLSAIYLEKKDFAASWNYICHAKDNIQRSPQKERLRFLYPVMSNWYSANGQPDQAKAYLDSAIAAINAYNENFNAIKILRAQQKITVQEQELILAEMNLEKQRQVNQRNMLTVLIVVLCLVLGVFYFVQKKKQLLKDLKLQRTTHNLEIANLNLNSFTRSISEKNRLIEQLQSHRSEQDKTSLISQLQQSTILTDEDWKTFQQLFEQVYPGFISRVKQTYPNISLGEIRYFVLAKLNLSYKEMAAMLGVSPNTVQVMRHRIRKKLNFSDNDIMDQNIHAI